MLIDVPFSPKFILKCAQYVFPAANYHEEQAHTKESIYKLMEGKNHLDREGIDKDIPRTAWRLGKGSETVIGLKDLIKANAADSSLNKLSDSEIQTLYAFALSTAGLVSEKNHHQGGFYHADYTMHNIFWLSGFGGVNVIDPGLDSMELRPDGPNEVSRDKEDITLLRVTHGQKIKEVDDYPKSELPLVVYRYNYLINKKEGKFYAKIDDNDYEFKVDEIIWKTDILPRVKARFKDPAKWTNMDLFNLIPCLFDEDITKGFIEKLTQQSPEINKMADDLIALCFENRKDDLDRISNAIKKEKEKSPIEIFKKRGEAFKRGVDLLVEHSDLTPGVKEKLTIAVDHVSKSYNANLDFNEAPSHDSMKETLDDYLCKLAILFSKHGEIDIKRATKQIMLAECMAAWDQGRGPIITDSMEGKDAIQQEEIPRRLLTKHQKEEFLGLMQGKKPKWFSAMEDWQQRYILQHLKKPPTATLENIDDRLLTIPSSLRFIPGLANYSEHILKVTNTETGKILHESSRMRSSVVCAIDLSDNKLTAERQRITDDNIEQVLLNAINDIKEKLPKNLNAKVKEEILQRNAILEIPITIQTLLSPSVLQSFSVLLGSGGVSDAAMVENKNIAIDKFIKLFENPKSKASEEMFKHLGLSKEGLIDVAFEGEPVKIKPIIIATNHPVNKLRTMKGPFDIEESKRNQLFSDKLLTLATKPYIAKDSGLLVAAVSNYKALLSNQKVTHAHRHLFMSSLEEIITEQCSGVAYGSCKSGKDRKGMEVLHTDAVLTYFAKYKELPSYFDGEVKRKQFIDIFVHLFNSGHQQDMASQNAPGARGIKELKNILSKDIYAAIEKSLPKDGLKEANQIASLNKPKTKLITVKALVEKNIEFLNEQGLLPPEPINKAPFFQKPPIQVASIDNYHVSYKEVSPADYDQTLKNLLETKNKTKHHDQSVSVLTKEVPLDERNPGMIAIGEMGNGAIIVERTDHNQCARSELIKMPENLTLKNIWEQACNRLITENTVGSKLTVDQFNHLFESVSHTASAFGRNISKNDMTAVLHFGGVEHSHQIANKLFKYYNDRYQEVMYKKRKMGGDTFPSDELIGIAIKQVEGRIALDPNHPIVLKGSGHSLAYVEAVMLYCRAKGYAILNQSDYSIPDKLLSSARVERFLKLIEGQPNAFGYERRQVASMPNPLKH